MGQPLKQKVIKEYLLIIVGTTLLACAINLFFEKQDLVTGGVTGLAIAIKALSEPYFAGGIPLWLTNIALNIPLFLIGTMLRGKCLEPKPYLLPSIFLLLYIIQNFCRKSLQTFCFPVYSEGISRYRYWFSLYCFCNDRRVQILLQVLFSIILNISL